MSAEDAALRQFLRGEVDPRAFPHREHVRMGFELLRRCDFDAAVVKYANALRRITARAGNPDGFNLTVTLAFLALIAEHMSQAGECDFASFAAAHPQLFEKGLLKRWYRPERLASPLARRSFLLPDPPA